MRDAWIVVGLGVALELTAPEPRAPMVRRPPRPRARHHPLGVWRFEQTQPEASLPFGLCSPGTSPESASEPAQAPAPRMRRVSRSPRWERCIACDGAFSDTLAPKRWYGLCVPCYRATTMDERAFYNNVTQRWRKAAMRDFGKHDADALPVWQATPSPIQVMLLRLAHAFGLTTPPGCEGTLCEGLDRRLGCDASVVDAAIRGHQLLPAESRRRLIDGALDWLAADEAHCAAMAELYPDEDEVLDPDDPDVLAVAAALRRSLGKVS
jgi:hypothetical protein